MRTTKPIRRAPFRVMRTGKTQRDHASGAWATHRRNAELRRQANDFRAG
jgi:hypothetical protein